MKNENNYPRVLVVGQAFNNVTGGGITLSNLFYGWPKENIALLSNNKIYIVANEICIKNYGLNRYCFPFNLFFSEKKIKRQDPKVPQNPYVNRFAFVLKTGLVLLFQKRNLDRKTISWIRDFNPDIIYSQLADYSLMVIVKKICLVSGKPLILHFMDDWPSIIYKGGGLNYYYRKKTLNLLGELINRSKLLLCISEKMKDEYQFRYAKPCVTLYNSPITISKEHEKIFKIDKKKIGYFGRIGKACTQSLLDLIDTIINIPDIELLVTSPDYKTIIKYAHYSNIKIYPSVNKNDLNNIIETIDLLFIPIDFDENSIIFSKYSLSTKALEYMTYKIPILIYAPKNIALTDFFKDNNCGLIVDERSVEKLQTFVKEYYNGEIDVSEIMINSEKVLHNYANMEKNRDKFLNLLNGIS